MIVVKTYFIVVRAVVHNVGEIDASRVLVLLDGLGQITPAVFSLPQL